MSKAYWKYSSAPRGLLAPSRCLPEANWDLPSSRSVWILSCSTVEGRGADRFCSAAIWRRLRCSAISSGSTSAPYERAYAASSASALSRRSAVLKRPGGKRAVAVRNALRSAAPARPPSRRADRTDPWSSARGTPPPARSSSPRPGTTAHGPSPRPLAAAPRPEAARQFAAWGGARVSRPPVPPHATKRRAKPSFSQETRNGTRGAMSPRIPLNPMNPPSGPHK